MYHGKWDFWSHNNVFSVCCCDSMLALLTFLPLYKVSFLLSPTSSSLSPLTLLNSQTLWTFVHTASSSLHRIISILIPLRDSEIFSNTICPTWTLSFSSILPLKRNSQHEPHTRRHVTDSAPGMWRWACSSEWRENFLLCFFSAMCVMYMWTKLTSDI
jgi:hypothetical protein